ncbi:carbon-nitrogen hydrolase family protein [Natronomonas salina]|uniref:carbon-nitrogen hydrolase family protein n=1 Tax=Natronomonas salina TaxID=1710540 RepID=UPI0015B75D32|nr:carbon-nitrogen hydrolase family protein [Natronomonas salina]QLD89140.1 carbon-nitrogen hydrolase family protein [Natronomonas salina]
MTPKVAAIQFEAGPDATPAANLDRGMDIIRETAADVDIACLPEYFATPYFPAEQKPENFDLAVRDDSKFVDQIRKTAAETNTAVIAPVFEEGYPGGRYYNTALIINANGDLAGKYRKLHPFQRPGYNETYYFSAGDLGAPVFDIGDLTVGVMICFDRHFPEIARVQALRGADVVFVPTCSFGEENRDEVWVKELTGIAVSNSIYVVGVNRAGTEDGQLHFGASTVIDPRGEELATLGNDPNTLVTEVSPSIVTNVRRTTKHLNDIRKELLPDLESL